MARLKGQDLGSFSTCKIFRFSSLHHRGQFIPWGSVVDLFDRLGWGKRPIRTGVVLELWASRLPTKLYHLGPPQIGTSAPLSSRRVDCIMTHRKGPQKVGRKIPGP